MKKALRFALIPLVFAGCSEEPLGYEYLDQFSLAMLQGGDGGVYFLPPLLQPAYAGTFDAERNPVVVVCAGAAPAPCADPVAQFDMVQDEGEEESRVVRVSLLEERYMVNWKAADQAQGLYRIFVTEDDAMQAFVDVALTRGGTTVSARRIREYGATAPREFNGTLPIAFRMEERVVQEPSTGLSAQYYDWRTSTPDFTTAALILERIDPVIDFTDPVGDADVFGIGQSERYMVRWSGAVVIEETGFYTFCVYSDTGSRLYVNNYLFFDRWNEGGLVDRCASYYASAAGPLPIRIEWQHAAGPTTAQLFWENTGSIERQIIPSSALQPN